MVDANAMQRILAVSGIGSELYTLENAKEFASLIMLSYSSDELEHAVRDALDEQVEYEEAGRLQVFVPFGDVNVRHIEDCLSEPHKYKFKRGEENEGLAIYGRRIDAFNGKTKSGKEHSFFFVYDTNAAVMTDFIGKDGKSLMNPSVRNVYLSSLEKSLGYSVAWQEKPLCDIEKLNSE